MCTRAPKIRLHCWLEDRGLSILVGRALQEEKMDLEKHDNSTLIFFPKGPIGLFLT